TQALDLDLGLRLVDVVEPALGARHWARIEQRLAPTERRGTGPEPILGALHQAGADGIALDVAEDGQQVVVLLDRKATKSSLPDVAAGVIVLVVAADMGGEQPHHVVAQVAVLA